MSLRVAIQMDPPARLNPAGDSTIILAQEAAARGHTLYYYEPHWLTCTAGNITTIAYPLSCTGDPVDWFHLGDAETLNLADMHVVLMRQDPPYDMRYLSATYLLEQVSDHVLVVNNPTVVRNLPEKIFPLHFAEYMPETLIASSKEPVYAFLKEHGDIVIKPLYGFGGHDVFRLREGADNIDAILETLFTANHEPFMAQRFLPEVDSGDRRIILIDGKVEGVSGRIPAAGEIRANFRVGGSAAKAELTPRQQEICDKVGAYCREHGLLFVGLDVIGDYLTEINITSPTGLRAVKDLYGVTPEKRFWDAVEARVA